MCASVITVIAPFNSSTLRCPPSGHARRHKNGNRQPWQGLRVGRLQQEGRLGNHCHVCLSVRLSLSVSVHVCVWFVCHLCHCFHLLLFPWWHFFFTGCPSISVLHFQPYFSLPCVQLFWNTRICLWNPETTKCWRKGAVMSGTKEQRYPVPKGDGRTPRVCAWIWLCGGYRYQELIYKYLNSLWSKKRWQGEEWDKKTGVSQAGLKCTSLIIKQHVVMVTVNGESGDEKERTKEMRETLHLKNYIAEKLSKSPTCAALHWSQVSDPLTGGI